MTGILERLLEGRHLAEQEAATLLRRLACEPTEPALGGALLAALRAKPETAEELRGFAGAMRELARRPLLPPGRPYVDIVGTGGDGSGSLNLSTGSALLAAAAGLPVVKHGNRSVSSRCGSADVLEALGYELPADEAAAAASLERYGFTFLFAPWFHPAMRRLGELRGALGVRTVFNMLGPLCNPAGPPFHVIGAFSAEAARLMAATLAGMPIRRAFVVHGTPGWDEPTPVGPFLLLDVRRGAVEEAVEDPADAGISRCEAASLRGGDATANAAALAEALGGTAGPHLDALLLGASLALRVTGREPDRRRALERARAAVEDGTAAALLAALRGRERRVG